jgi:hypothetical protein
MARQAVGDDSRRVAGVARDRAVDMSLQQGDVVGDEPIGIGGIEGEVSSNHA